MVAFFQVVLLVLRSQKVALFEVGKDSGGNERLIFTVNKIKPFPQRKILHNRGFSATGE